MISTRKKLSRSTKVVKVWVIDDNEEFCTVTSEAINESDFARCTQCFLSCEKALEALQEETNHPHVILLDIGLPGMSGLAAIEPIKKLEPVARIIMLTVNDQDEAIYKAIYAGASGYLLKPSSVDDLLEAIKTVMDGGAPMNPFVVRKILGMMTFPPTTKENLRLTPKERDILKLIVDGLTTQSIAENLRVSYHTVDTHLKHVYSKLDVHTRNALVAKVLKQKLL